jgi:uncharacterized membrane protein YeaQ/YmgE (transglycosylase-associated protein family)
MPITMTPQLELGIVLIIGVLVGLLMHRVGRSWLGRKVANATGIGHITYSLVGIAGAFIGYHIAGLLAVASPLTYVAAAVGALAVIWLWRGR